MKKFTVKRSKWLRGTGNGKLLNLQGKMCCLGFAVNQICRIPKKKLLREWSPLDVVKDTLRDGVFTKDDNNKYFVEQAIKANDNGAISDKAREARLTKIFKKAGIKVIFKD